jgi:predicted ATPase/DNA-binding winged helix-turn-helix (wHTH) protein/Tfp pilus assembly protein PilF
LETGPLTYRFGEFTLDVARGCVLKGEEEIKLRPKVYEALKYLVENSGRLIGKQELIQAVWPDTFVTDDSLVQCTVELRRALDDRNQQLLKTVPRRGYLLAAQVIQCPTHPEGLSVSGSILSTETCKLPLQKAVGKRFDLPTPRTSLVGRDQEVAQAAELVLRSDVRLLSLTGAGGAGKTRLAIAVASAVADKFTAGVQFVGLASITYPDLVSAALAKALDIQQVANRTISQLIAEQLQEDSGSFLLVLDNFEQVLPAATILAEILAACPSLKILVTSRSCLRIYGEQEFPVAPLAQSSAVELFAQRATAVRPTFKITAENAAAVRETCSRLDGLPLAIELAAARTKVLSPSAILDRLQSRLQLLTGGALDLPERQQTLRKTIDWSHDLLNEAEQKLFRRFSVFVGGSTLEASEAVCDTGRDLGIDPFDGLSSLVDKNLVQRVDSDSEPRFVMLETIREYALERLTNSGEELAVRRAHAAYCLVLAEEGNPELSPAERRQWLARCDLEIDNFRSALDWLFENQHLDWALRICMALFRFWEMREHLTEGRARLETILRLTSDGHTKERAKLGIFVGALMTAQGDFPAAQRFLEQSLSLYESLGDRWGIASSLNALAVSARDRGDYHWAQTNFERSLARWRTLSDPLSTARCLHNLANVVKVRGDYSAAQSALQEATSIFEQLGDRSGAAWSINQQGDIAREQGDVDVASHLYEGALAMFREAGDRWGSARSLTDLGYIYCEQGRYEAAHATYREALEAFADLGHRRGIARALEGSACLAAARGQADRAIKLAAAAAHLRHLISAPLPQAEQLKLDQTLLPAWQSLGEPEGQRAWADGSSMNLEKAIQYCLEKPEPAISQ